MQFRGRTITKNSSVVSDARRMVPMKFSSRNRSNPHYVTPEVKIPPPRRTGPVKALIAVFCCHKYRSWAQTIRDTWAKDAPVDIRFFIGRPAGDAPQPDEVFLDANDSQEG